MLTAYVWVLSIKKKRKNPKPLIICIYYVHQNWLKLVDKREIV